MGQPHLINEMTLKVILGSEPREVKHLSTWWKIKQLSRLLYLFVSDLFCWWINMLSGCIPLVVASEKGEAQTVNAKH